MQCCLLVPDLNEKKMEELKELLEEINARSTGDAPEEREDEDQGAGAYLRSFAQMEGQASLRQMKVHFITTVLRNLQALSDVGLTNQDKCTLLLKLLTWKVEIGSLSLSSKICM